MSKASGFKCPWCGAVTHTEIIDTRRTDYGKRRRRVCSACRKKFSTVEFAVMKSSSQLYSLLLDSIKEDDTNGKE